MVHRRRSLAEHPDIAEVAVTELSVRDDVKVIAAYIVPREGITPDKASIEIHAKENLAAYKCPREIVFVEKLPRTANGKVMRRALHQPD